MRRKLEPVAILFAILFAVVALAADGEGPGQGSVPNHYPTDKQTAAYRTGLSSADSTTIDATFSTNVAAFGLQGRRNLAVSARFSASGATVSVQAVFYYVNPAGTALVLGVSDPVTLTAGTSTVSSKYVAPSYVFDGFGANVVRVRVSTAVSSGTCDLWCGSF